MTDQATEKFSEAAKAIWDATASTEEIRTWIDHQYRASCGELGEKLLSQMLDKIEKQEEDIRSLMAGKAELNERVKESVEFEISVIQLADNEGMDEDWSAYGESQKDAAARFLDARLTGADITSDTWMSRANDYEKERDSLVVLLRRWEAAANHIFGTQEICRVELMSPISVIQAEAIEYAGKRLWDEVGTKILNKARIGVLSYTKSYADEIRQQAQEAAQ